jgi:hypothetical protein
VLSVAESYKKSKSITYRKKTKGLYVQSICVQYIHPIYYAAACSSGRGAKRVAEEPLKTGYIICGCPLPKRGNRR